MIDRKSIDVFQRYRDAGNFAFGGGGHAAVVTEEDKEAYWAIHQELIQACEASVAQEGLGDSFYVKPRPYSRERGARGHRPLDLWCAVRNRDSEAYNEMPQIYVIVSDRGLEIGFAVSIPESDYHDQAVKIQNREIIPQIHRKLPAAGAVVAQLDQIVRASPDWHVNGKTRLIRGDAGFDQYELPSELFAALKAENVCYGGGSICRIVTPETIETTPIDVAQEFRKALPIFSAIQLSCRPTESDKILADNRNTVREFAEEIEFSPDDEEDGRRKILQSVAVRQGQATFRRELLEAYGGRCAVTGCGVSDVLQAAHIIPYNGQHTNHPSNGLLLRSDIHVLFDLFLISVDPKTYSIQVSNLLHNSEYADYHGQQINVPDSLTTRPNAAALAWHLNNSVLG